MAYSIGIGSTKSGLLFEYAIPSGTFEFGVTPHCAIGGTKEGEQFVVWSRNIGSDRYDVACAFFNRGSNLMDDCLYLYHSNLPGSGAHFGANQRGQIVHSIYDAVDPMPYPDDPLRNSIIVTEIGKDVRIIVQPHGSNGMIDYDGTPRANIAGDGKHVAYANNNGIKGNVAVYVVPTDGHVPPHPPTCCKDCDVRFADLERRVTALEGKR